MNKDHFKVDAALLEELGEKLIGRAPIALAELVKNSYDADAHTCRIEIRDDTIVVSDDGTGISEDEFRNFWMRIGTTHKIDQSRSEGGRPLTGSKGIGRLSVQFLADEMILESTSEKTPGRTLFAIVDWSTIERGKDLKTVKVEWEMRDDAPQYPNNWECGTRITLVQLRNEWDAAELESFGSEVWRLRSPFKKPPAGKRIRRKDQFAVEVNAPGIENARESFDKMWLALFDNWRAKIRGNLTRGRYGSEATVSVEFKQGYPQGANDSQIFRETVPLPLGDAESSYLDKASFEILVFRTSGRQAGGITVGKLREYLADYGNVSVYDAGFRLPYYGSEGAAGQDWLSIALDQGRRIDQSQLLPEHLRATSKYMQDLPAPGRILGAVEIDTNHERAVALRGEAEPGEWLQIQPGRDRLHDNKAFSQLRDLVRFSLDFYASRHRLRLLRAKETRRAKEPPSKKYDRALSIIEENKDRLPHSVFSEVRREIKDARHASVAQESEIDSRAALLAPLATAGMTALALLHELSREIRFFDRAAGELHQLAEQHKLPSLLSIAEEFDSGKLRLLSLRQLFSPLSSEADTTAAHRLRARAIVEQTIESMQTLTPGVHYDASSIPSELRFPLGALAEWNAVLQNAFSNSWNAMLDSFEKKVRISGSRTKGGKELLMISDTGQGLGVDLREADRLFDPFERKLSVSTDNRSLVIGGQGLGLPIIRMITSRREAKCRFVRPEPDFSTTLEISWSGSK